ncbi:MAG: hypothetical protein GY828_06440 [Candidatus Gracilibacteria bacterium]|nr:hypothetical protein [Candidatus Gracilibacteria bacterium]
MKKKDEVINFLEQSIFLAGCKTELSVYDNGNEKFKFDCIPMDKVPRELYVEDNIELSFIHFVFSNLEKDNNGNINVKMTIKCKGFLLQGELYTDGINTLEGEIKITELDPDDKTIFSISFDEM